MKKIFLTFVAAVVCMAASAQLPEQVDAAKAEINKYRRIISDKTYTLVSVGDADDREDVVDDIEDIFDDLEHYLEKRVSALSSSKSIHKTISLDDFYFVQTPTTVNVKFGDFSFFSTPVTYEYNDGDVNVRIAPTTQFVKTSAFIYEASPMRYTFKTIGDMPAGDTVRVGGTDKFRMSVIEDKSGDFNMSMDTIFDRVDKDRRFDIRIHHRGRHGRDIMHDRKMNYFYIGLNNIINDENKIDDPHEKFMELNSGRSIEIGLYSSMHRWSFSHFMAMDLGIDFRLNHYSFANTFNLVKHNGYISADYDNVPVEEFKRHNLRLAYLSLPLTIEWRIGSSTNPLYIHTGLEGSIRIGCREKQVYKIEHHGDNERKVQRFRNSFETNLLRYACNVAVGYRHFELYCRYSPMQLFKDGHGPELYPVSFGVRFM